MTGRIERLLEHLRAEDEKAFFYERTPLLEEAWQKWEHEETGRRYALAFAYLLDNITLVLKEDELLVGTPKEIVPNEEQEAEYQRLLQNPMNQFDMQGYFGFEALGLLESKEWVERYAPAWFFCYGHHKYSIESVLEKGFSGIREFINGRLKEDALSDEQIAFYENGRIICDGIERLTGRIKDFLRGEAEKCLDEKRKKEILCMADNFERIPMQPACTFYQAVQTVWFLQFINSNICGARDYAFGSMDQYLYPYYRRDIDKGILTKKFAFELMENLFIKMNETIGTSVWFNHPKRTLANHSVQYVYVGGCDAAGNDLINELSWIMLEAHGELKLHQPSLHVHYHKNMDQKFVRRAAEILKTGRCEPAFYNDRVVVEALVKNGIPEEDAKKFTHFGCCNVNLDSMEDEIREIWNIMPKYVELALNNGRDMLTDEILTEESTPIEALTDIDKVYDAVMKHFRIALDKALAKVAEGDRICMKNKTFSFESLMLPDCLKKGRDMTRYTKYKHCNVHGSGMATAGDSLYAIDRLVFREHRMTLSELRDILKYNWAGQEELRQEILNKFPKFGNDDDTVDSYTVKLANRFIEETHHQSPIKYEPEGYNRVLFPTIYTLQKATDMGRVTAASADGRMEGETISENQSPTYGAPEKGPTAMLNSIAKLPLEETPGGGFNFTLQKQFLGGEDGADRLAQLINGYFANNGLHMQIMVTDEKELEDAMEHPEKHRNLVVRVTGFSAYFVVLTEDVQREVINRIKSA